MLDLVIQTLADNLLLTLFLVMAAGAAIGAIPFGPLKFGAAGALFVGLAVGAVVPMDSEHLTIFQDLGLGLFVYLVGLEAGETFFKEFREQLGLMMASVVAVTLGAVAAVAMGGLLGLVQDVSVGVFAGALTSTPSLALAQEQSGSATPAVGYSLGYPTGVAVAIILVALVIAREWGARNDQVNPEDLELSQIRVKVEHMITQDELDERLGTQVRLATVQRGGGTWVVEPGAPLRTGDVVTLWATRAALPAAVELMGHEVPRRRLIDRKVTVRRFTVSNRDIAGSSIGALPLYGDFRARIARVQRADDDILATSDTYLEMGDVVEVVLPVRRFDDVETFFGNSVRTVSELDSVAAAGGLALGFLAALLVVPLPGGSSFALGAAAGPLLVGMVLGAVRRTGVTAWQLPRQANFTLRKFGLMLFLAAVGLASGPAFAATAFTLTGLQAVLLAVVVSIAGCGSFLLISKLMGQSPARAVGGVSGLLGQPAVLQYALGRSTDGRIMTGYATTFAVALLYKIIIVPFLYAF